MKRRIHSADPYVEFWVKNSGSSRQSTLDTDDAGSSGALEDLRDRTRFTTTIKWGMLFPLWEESFQFHIPCQYTEAHPSSTHSMSGSRSYNSSHGAEDKTLSPTHEGDFDNKTMTHPQVAIEDDSLRIIVRDATKSEIATADVSNLQSIIGECFLDFSSLLDQKNHTIWLPIIDTGEHM